MYRSISTFSLVLLAAFAPASPGAGESADSMTIVITRETARRDPPAIVAGAAPGRARHLTRLTTAGD